MKFSKLSVWLKEQRGEQSTSAFARKLQIANTTMIGLIDHGATPLPRTMAKLAAGLGQNINTIFALARTEDEEQAMPPPD